MSNSHASQVTEAGYPDPVFQAFAVKTTRGRAQEKVDRAIKDLLGTGWQIQTYGGKRSNFEVFATEGALTASEAWAVSYQLRAYRGIASAEPVLANRSKIRRTSAASRSTTTSRRSWTS